MRCFYVLKKWSSAKLSLNWDLSLNKVSLNRDCTVQCSKWINLRKPNMSELEFLRVIRKSGSPDTCWKSWCSGRAVLQKSQKNLHCLRLHLILIILGSVQVSVQMEQDKPENVLLPASTSDKDTFVLELEPGKEVGKNLGKWNMKYLFLNFPCCS